MNMHVNISFKLINQRDCFNKNKSYSKAKSLNVLTIFRVLLLIVKHSIVVYNS